MTKREQFFYDNAGYSYDSRKETIKEGRTQCAKSLAKAEEDAELIGVTFDWQPDDNADWSWMDQEGYEKEKSKEHEVYFCIAKNHLTNETTSLGSIFDPSDEYRRVVEAELALELLD